MGGHRFDYARTERGEGEKTFPVSGTKKARGPTFPEKGPSRKKLNDKKTNGLLEQRKVRSTPCQGKGVRGGGKK